MAGQDLYIDILETRQTAVNMLKYLDCYAEKESSGCLLSKEKKIKEGLTHFRILITLPQETRTIFLDEAIVHFN